jgi:hypothetical protein
MVVLGEKNRDEVRRSRGRRIGLMLRATILPNMSYTTLLNSGVR